MLWGWRTYTTTCHQVYHYQEKYADRIILIGHNYAQSTAHY